MQSCNDIEYLLSVCSASGWRSPSTLKERAVMALTRRSPLYDVTQSNHRRWRSTSVENEPLALKQRCDVQRIPCRCERIGGSPERQDGLGATEPLDCDDALRPSCGSTCAENAFSCALS
jgi:hypothetical protein